MARMHGSGHGKSKSRKPVVELGKIPSDATVTKEQVEELIVKYAKQGMGPAQIGERLKIEHKIPYIRQYTGKRLMEILKEKKLAGEIPPDLMDLMKTAVTMHKHLEKNKQDKHNTLRLRRIESKIWRLTKYYVREGKLPDQWRYDPKQAELLIKGNA
ncbi:MAG: 30S ribosomal protein S15 [Candidatus Micrarchaeales archaeon]